VLVRYADDLVVLCATRKQAEAARELVAAILAGLGLRLSPEKTRIVHLARGAEGFDFLGFHHRMGRSRKDGVGICCSGRRRGRWPRSGPGSAR
jgi:RNA-directed DNA polymerase